MLKVGGAVVFGGSRGIGRAICLKLAEDGFTVAVASRNRAACNQLAAELPNSTDHVGVTCDLSQPTSVQAACADIDKHLGRNVRVLVNCAGVVKDAICPRIQLPDIEEQLQVNLVGPMLTCKHFSTVMMKQRQGCIVNVGSITGSTGNTGQGVYSASKAGLAAFTKCTAKELARFGVRANVVEPGYITTDMTAHFQGAQKDKLVESIPLKRFGAADEIAEAVRFLIGNTYVTGEVIRVDGGLSLQF